ncbi:MAG: dihydrolipoyl dehydrogenase [Deltaproteobacteria bacterium]|nr:dihydrolipoyl dehydrogenase [Deltaproteobacteria bacterium]
MPLEIVMPKLGLTMTEGLIIGWKKAEGDQVKKGDILFVLETEKVTYEVESPEDGILGKIHVQAGETVSVGIPVAHLLKPGEDASVLEQAISRLEKMRTATEAMEARPTSMEGHSPVRHSEMREEGRAKASPLAKRAAREQNIDLRAVIGTGPDSMIIKEDVDKARQSGVRAISSASLPPDVLKEGELVPHSGMRLAIAKNMMASKVETAQTYMSNTADAGKIVQYRKEMLQKIQDLHGVKITVTDLLMKVTAAAIAEHPIINTRWTDQGTVFIADVHMGMAMALDDGLIVPVIRDINKKSIAQIAEDRIELIQKGRNKGFLPDDISGSTFTLSAMGMFGTEQFTANINVPENAILAVGAIIDKPVVVDGGIQIRPMMNLTLTYDHRAIDGAEAGKFMRTLMSLVEDPVPVLEQRVIPGDAPESRITIIGGGMGGYPAAIKAARMGARVTLIEKGRLGGVCLNWGCIPTKSLLQSCQVIKTVTESDLFGVRCGDHQIDLKSIMGRKNRVVSQLREGVEKLLAAKQVRVIQGTAQIMDPSSVQVRETGETVQSDKVIIASGSRPRKLGLNGMDGPGIWDSDDFLEMKRLPKRVAIIGGGVIGVEFAQILHRLGSDVTILEMLDGLVPGVDREIALALEQRLVEEGIKVFTKAAIGEIKNRRGSKTVEFTANGRTMKCVASKVIVAVGRSPDLSWLNTDRLGLATKDGALRVNERMETSVPGIYGVGDVVGGIMLAHVAMAEGECAAKNAMGDESEMRYDVIPSCVYTSPEVAVVGFSEEKARERFDIEVGRFSFHGSGKALVLNETFGMVKILSDKRSGRVIGVHMIGPHATDMIGEAVLGMSMKMTVQELARAVHPHPSLSEAVMESALSLCGGATHMP